MSRPQCTFCDHANPPASKYCTACGARLRVVACASCDALNDVNAGVCYQCAEPLPPRDIAFEVPALTTAETTADPARPASAGGDVYDRTRPPLPESSRTSLASDTADSEVVNDAGNAWAGSAPAALTGFAQAPIATRSSVAERAKPFAITLAVAVLAGLAFYAYRNSVDDTPQSAWIGVVNRGDGPTGAANDTSPSAGGKQDATGVGRDPVAACTEAVTALGLCSPQSTQRKD
jgi:hypothetical protein